mgnify:CR=1 FL=1
MAFVVPVGTEVIVELTNGATKQLLLPIDLRREWEQRTTTPCELSSGLESFLYRFNNGIVVHIICDVTDVMEFKPQQIYPAVGFAG